MAVAALSTSAIALSVGAGPPANAPSSPEAPVMFAQLVAQATSGDKGAQDGTAAEPGSEAEAESDASAEDMLAAAPADETKESTADQPVNLLAEIEAMVAAAAQVTVSQPVAAPATAAAQPIVPAGEAPAAVSAATAPTTRTAAVIVNVPLPAAPPPASPAAATGDAMPPARQDGIGQQVEAPTPASPAVPEAAAAVAPNPAATAAPAAAPSIPSDIASLLASLKAAFAPVGQPRDGEAAARAPAVPTAAQLATAPAPAPAADVQTAAPTTAAPTTDMPGAQPAVSAATIAAPGQPLVPAEAALAAVANAVETDTTAIVPTQDGKLPATKAASGRQSVEGQVQPAPVPPGTAPVTQPAQAPALAAAPLFQQDDRPAAETVDATAPATAAPAAAAVAVPQAVVQPAQPFAALDTTAPAGGPAQADQIVTRQLDLARDNQWLDRLAHDISQAATQQGHLKFQLNPEHLGALTVEIANSASGTAIRMTAETDQARAIIADAQPRLLAEVRAQGLRVSESHVDLSNQGNGGYGSSSANGQQGQPGQQRQPSSADHQPFARRQAAIRDDAADSASRDNGELYA